MNDDTWETQFRALFNTGTERHRQGRQSPGAMFEADEVAFLESIGCSAQELFDFVDDHVCCGDINYDDVVAVTAIRHDHFKNELHSQCASRRMGMDEFPAKTDEVEGIPWLPRLITKARAKLRGELPADLMYG